MFTPFCCRFADRTCVVFPAPVVLLLWREGRHSLFGFLAQKISRMHLAKVLYARALFQPKVRFSAQKLNRMTCTHPNTSRSLTNRCQHPSMLSLHRGRLAWRRNKSAPCNRTCNSVSNSWLHSIIRTCFTMSYTWSTCHPLVASVQTSTKAPNKTWQVHVPSIGGISSNIYKSTKQNLAHLRNHTFFNATETELKKAEDYDSFSRSQQSVLLEPAKPTPTAPYLFEAILRSSWPSWTFWKPISKVWKSGIAKSAPSVIGIECSGMSASITKLQKTA